ncbi:hypothetical protein AVEN_54089-1 [Araneus ventricosus]|uniref:Uncharacterized protein n=1 Tax=Araneus ventricosus TaxID=182803 RepID=A0A4Y2BW14_ARAVE|nr:hypothetical protein AVEN_54089-1 [Araneus ventricosus]
MARNYEVCPKIALVLHQNRTKYEGRSEITGELGCFHVIEVDVHPCLITCDDPEKKLRDEEVRRAVENFLHSLGTDFHQDGFLKLISQYNKCINVSGEYVEK